MNRKHIQQLRVHTGPALTIICLCKQPTLKNAIDAAENKLADAGQTRLLDQLYLAQKGIICPPHQSHKLAIFVDEHRALSFVIPNDVPETITVSQSFVLEPIIASLCHKKRYWVIDCTNEIPLREGCESFVNEFSAECITALHSCPTDMRPEFCFDKCIGQYLESDQLPIIIVGDAHKTTYFTLLAPYQEHIIAHVPTIDSAWGAYQEWYQRRTAHMLQQIAQGKPGLDFITEITQLLEFSYQGHITTLLIEEHYHHIICQHRLTGQITQSDHCPIGYEEADLVEKLLLNICAKGGELLFVPDQSLAQFGHIAAFVIEFFLEDTLTS